jgi:hypothetical protein
MASYYSQLGRTDLWFYDGVPIKLNENDPDSVPRACIEANTRVTGPGVTFTPSFTFKGQSDARALLRNIAEPQLTTDAATKYYVDSVASGLTVKGSVTLRTMGHIEATYGQSTGGVANDQLSATGSFGSLLAKLFDLGEESNSNKTVSQTSFTFVANADETVATRILVMSQSTAKKTQNGVYYLADDGVTSLSWKLVRAKNFNDDPSGEIKAGSFVFVTDGTKHKNHGFVLVADGASTILKTASATPAENNNLNFEQFSGAGQLKAGDNIEITGDTVALKKVVSGLTSLGTETITASGAATVASLGVTGAATVGTLSSGEAVLSQTLNVSGLVTANQGVKVTSGGLVVGTLGVTTRSEAVKVNGSAYIEGEMTLTGVVTSTNTGRSAFSGTMLVGSFSGTVPTAAESTTLVVAGSAYVDSGLTVAGASVLKSTLTVDGAITANDIATFSKQVTVNALLKSSTLDVTGTATIAGAADLKDKLDVSAATNLKSTLEVGAAATLKSSLTVSGDTAIAGASSTVGASRLVGRVEIGSALTVTDLSVYKAAQKPDRLNSKLGVAGDVWVDEELRVMETCLLANEGTAVVDIGTTSITGIPERGSSKLRVAGSAYVDGSLYTGISANIGGDLSVTGTATVSGVTNLKSRTDIGTVPLADVSGAMLAVYGSLDVTGTTLMRDKVHIGSTLTTTQQGNTAVTGAALVVNGSAYVEDNLVVNKDLRVNNDSVFVDSVTISGITNIGSFITATPAKPAEGLTPATDATLTVTGNTTFNGANTDKTTVTTLFDVTNNSLFTGTVSVEKEFYVGKSGSAKQSTFYGQIQVHDGDLVVNPGSSGTQKKLLATGEGSEVGYIRFGKNGNYASISSTLSNTTVNFVDNNVTTAGDFSGKDLKATGNVTALGTGTFSSGCYSSNFYATSDARLKREVSTVSDALEKCSKLRGVTFKWVTGEDQREQLGLIAQETQQVYPSLVSEHEGYLRVDYPKLVGLLIEAVKELDERTRPVAAA